MYGKFPFEIGKVYEIVPHAGEDWPIVALVYGYGMAYFNELEELELDGKILRLHFSHNLMEFEHVRKTYFRFLGMYGKEEIIE